MTETSTTSDVHTMVVTRDAVDVLSACRNHVNALTVAFGEGHDYTTKASLSLMRQTTLLFSQFFGGQSRISKDGDLSLFVSTSSGFVYGLIFHRSWYDYELYNEERDGRPLVRDAKYLGLYCHAHKTVVARGQRDAHSANECVVYGTPVPGTWSFHS